MNKYMQIADELSKQNLLTNAGGPFGAVVVKVDKNNEQNKYVVGVGNNNVLCNNDPTAHAEIMAIRDACKNLKTYDLENCELYTSCYPCPMCLSAIIWANIKKVYFGNTKEDAADIGFRDDMIYKFIQNMDDKNSVSDVLTTIPMDREETIKTFNMFMQKPDKTMY